MNTAKDLLKEVQKEAKSSGQKPPKMYKELINAFPPEPITSDKKLKLALKITEHLMAFSGNNKQEQLAVQTYLKNLAKLIELYENDRFKFQSISGLEMLKYLMELQKLKQKDLTKELGGQSVVSKILAGERELNVKQIKALAKRFKVAPALFL